MTGQRSHMRRLLSKHEFYLALILVVLVGAIGIANPAFLTLSNLFDLCKSSTVIGLFSLGVLLVLIGGGIDISFAAIGVFSMYVTSRILLAAGFHGSVWAAFVLAGFFGLVLGLFNAFFITVYRLPALIVTLGSASVFRGFLLAFVGTSVVNNLPAGMVAFSKHTLFERTGASGGTVGLSSSFLLYVLAIVIVGLVLRHTLLGRGIYAMGGNPVAAERVGFDLRRLQFFIYGFVGLLSGLAGLVHACTMRNANPFDLVGNELPVIAAVVLGGASITGGRGTVVGTVLGVFLIVVINNSLILLDIPSYWQKVVVGCIIIASIGMTTRGAADRPAGIGLC
jgi:simple sugar transport system permease protein